MVTVFMLRAGPLGCSTSVPGSRWGTIVIGQFGHRPSPPNSDMLAVSGYHSAQVWDIKSLKPYAPHHKLGEAILGPEFLDFTNGVAFPPDGLSLLTGNNTAAHQWALADHRRTKSFACTDEYGAEAVAMTPDGKTVFVGCVPEVYVFDAASGNLQKNYVTSSYIQAVALN